MLYQGVILEESGLAAEAAAVRTFLQAIEELSDSTAEDRIRAHNNYANFLLNQAQDRLYNHAFQMAAGSQQPVLAMLANWSAADHHYRAALQLATALPPAQQAAVRLSPIVCVAG